jgi:hypothetical protein
MMAEPLAANAPQLAKGGPELGDDVRDQLALTGRHSQTGHQAILRVE